jgi:alpha-1,3-fucosyltransferase
MFYLSFENSVCDDYVTEKFWTYLSGKLVPIVLGGADYAKIAPPHSFINALDYQDPKDLANYLNYLISNQTAYNEYFQWTSPFNVYKNTDENFSRAMCQACAALNENPPKPKVYKDIKKWWRDEGNCNSKFPWTKNAMTSALDGWKDFMWDTAGQVMGSLREAKVIV